MTSSTTILLVPGAWHTPDCYGALAERLQKAGYNIDLVSLPSVGPEKHLSDFGPDVAQIRKQIEMAVETGQNVVVVAHSYGSIPASEAIKGLDAATRSEEGKTGGVTHFVFCAAFIIAEGSTLVGTFGGNDLPWFAVSTDREEVNPLTPAEIFYNDLTEEQTEAAISKLKPFSYHVFHCPVTYAAWRDVPSTYLYCAKDNAIPPQVQKMLVEQIAEGVNFRTETLASSHSPFLSMPDETAAAVRRAAGEPI